MNRIKWHWAFDQWLEDRVWTKIPAKYQSPHFFFMLGFITAFFFVFTFMIFF